MSQQFSSVQLRFGRGGQARILTKPEEYCQAKETTKELLSCYLINSIYLQYIPNSMICVAGYFCFVFFLGELITELTDLDLGGNE